MSQHHYGKWQRLQSILKVSVAIALATYCSAFVILFIVGYGCEVFNQIAYGDALKRIQLISILIFISPLLIQGAIVMIVKQKLFKLIVIRCGAFMYGYTLFYLVDMFSFSQYSPIPRYFIDTDALPWMTLFLFTEAALYSIIVGGIRLVIPKRTTGNSLQETEYAIELLSSILLGVLGAFLGSMFLKWLFNIY